MLVSLTFCQSRPALLASLGFASAVLFLRAVHFSVRGGLRLLSSRVGCWRKGEILFVQCTCICVCILYMCNKFVYVVLFVQFLLLKNSFILCDVILFYQP